MTVANLPLAKTISGAGNAGLAGLQQVQEASSKVQDGLDTNAATGANIYSQTKSRGLMWQKTVRAAEVAQQEADIMDANKRRDLAGKITY